MMLDSVAVLDIGDRRSVLKRLDARGRTVNGTPAAALLGQVSVSLMRMGL